MGAYVVFLLFSFYFVLLALFAYYVLFAKIDVDLLQKIKHKQARNTHTVHILGRFTELF